MLDRVWKVVPEEYLKTFSIEQWVSTVFANSIFQEQEVIVRWCELSSTEMDQTQAMLEFLQVCVKHKYYGATFFWVENYYKNKATLDKNMWLAVMHDEVVLLRGGGKRMLKRFRYEIHKFSTFPNALIVEMPSLESGKTESLRFTTMSGFVILKLIKRYIKRMRLQHSEETKPVPPSDPETEE